LRKRYDFEIQDVSQVDQTDRADGGFGSTGWFNIN
jgi:dUTPase